MRQLGLALWGLLFVLFSAQFAPADESWSLVQVPEVWKNLPAGKGGYSWYRARVAIPDDWQGRSLALFAEPVDDAREYYLNGHRVGVSGSFPPEFRSGLGGSDLYEVSPERVQLGRENWVAIRIYNREGRSGFNVAAPALFAGDDAIHLSGEWEFRAGDDATWARPQKLAASAAPAFHRIQPAEEVREILRRLPGEHGPLTVEQALEQFTTSDDLSVEVVLSEPEIGQPLDFKFDERGRLWVMNYKQYPNPAGLTAISRDKHLRTVFDKLPLPPPHHERGADTITVHEDTDGDGTFDHHKTFVTGLNIATSFARGREGLFVLNPPYLLFYPDRNADDVPDGDPEVLLEGFGLEDSHSVANNLRWGPDGWLYAAQGSTVTGRIRRYGSQEPPVHSMGQLIWRYHPESRRYEIFAEGGGNAFGVEIDSKGRLYSGHNGGNTRGFHYVQGGYFQKSFGKHGELSNPYAFGYFPFMTHHAVPRFTHAFIIYEGGRLPARYSGRLFGVGPLQSHVICSEMEPLGATFVTRDLDVVLTSKDPWFRPVQIRVGPDGAIYVADFYEQRIDHASHYQGRVTPETGRIYRLRSRDAELQPTTVDYAARSSSELLPVLSHPNKWHRQVAQRVLADRRDAFLTPALRQMLRDETGQTALEALWALHTAGGLTESAAGELLGHSSPFVRAWTIRLMCDDHSIGDRLTQQLAELALEEPNIEVRCQLACSARRLPANACLAIVANLLSRPDSEDPFQPLLLWWALEAHAGTDRVATLDLFRDDAFWNLPLVAEHIVQRLMRRYAQAGTRADLLGCARLLELAPAPRHVQVLLQGFEEAYVGRTLAELPESLITAMARAGGGSLTLRLRRGDQDAVREALQQIDDAQQPAERRAELIQILGQVQQPQVVPHLLGALQRSKNPQIRSAVFAALQAYDAPQVPGAILDLFASLSAEQREQAASLLASRRSWSRQLLQAVAGGTIDATSVSAAVVHKMALHDDDFIRSQVAEHWPELGASTTDQLRAEVARVQEMLLAGAGNPYAGEALFSQHCGKCHRLFDQGGNIGPDLTAYQRDDLQRVLLNVIHPSLEIREGFETFVVFMEDGRTADGFIADQDNRVVLLKSPDGQTLLLPRDKIEDLEPLRRSIMPEGILRNLTPQQIRDLFSYVRSTQPLP